jgi:hypothetical protein
MTGHQSLAALTLLAILIGATGAQAQSVGPDEAVGPSGAPDQTLQLTPSQRSAIYNAVMQERVRGSATGIKAAIGATVPPTIALQNLPDQAAIDAGGANDLKYAMVEGDVVIVDPIGMRVIDVIHPYIGR